MYFDPKLTITELKQLWKVSKKIIKTIEEGILELKTECYAKDKLKSPPFFPSFYDNF